MCAILPTIDVKCALLGFYKSAGISSNNHQFRFCNYLVRNLWLNEFKFSVSQEYVVPQSDSVLFDSRREINFLQKIQFFKVFDWFFFQTQNASIHRSVDLFGMCFCTATPTWRHRRIGSSLRT